MNKEKLKTFAAVMAALVCIGLWIALLRDLFGNVIFWLMLAGVLALLVVIVVSQAKRRRAFRQKGYEVVYEIISDDVRRFVYREQFDGGVRVVRLRAELIEVGHPVYRRLSSEDWAEVVPEWARDRQLQIEARILENPFYRPDGF